MTCIHILTHFILIFRTLYGRYAFFSFLGSDREAMISHVIAGRLMGMQNDYPGVSLGQMLKDVICFNYCLLRLLWITAVHYLRFIQILFIIFLSFIVQFGTRLQRLVMVVISTSLWLNELTFEAFLRTTDAGRIH